MTTRVSAATGAMAITVLLWASAFVAIRYVDRQLQPGALALGRLAVGSVALGVVMLIRGERPPTGRALGFTVICGVLWFGVYNLALNAGERAVDAGTSALLVNIGPPRWPDPQGRVSTDAACRLRDRICWCSRDRDWRIKQRIQPTDRGS